MNRTLYSMAGLGAVALASALLTSDKASARPPVGVYIGGGSGFSNGYYGGGYSPGLSIGVGPHNGYGYGYPGYSSGWNSPYTGYSNYNSGYPRYFYSGNSWGGSPWNTNGYVMPSYNTINNGTYAGSPAFVTDPSRQSFYYNPNASQAAPNGTIARVTVMVPDPNASVWIDDQESQQRGTMRSFETPVLQPGTEYRYRIRARWNQNGQPVQQEKTVKFEAGQQVAVSFSGAASDRPADRSATEPSSAPSNETRQPAVPSSAEPVAAPRNNTRQPVDPATPGSSTLPRNRTREPIQDNDR